MAKHKRRRHSKKVRKTARRKNKRGGGHHSMKPRLGVLTGLGVGVLRFGTTGGGGDILNIFQSDNKSGTAKAVIGGIVQDPMEAAIRGGVPILVGAAVSIGASKLGINKALARAKSPILI